MSSKTNNVYNCKNENWLFNGAYQWILSPTSGLAYYVFYVYSGGRVSSNGAHNTYGVRPVLFLKSDVVVSGGEGTESNPFILE